jgi:hypothetical protein
VLGFARGGVPIRLNFDNWEELSAARAAPRPAVLSRASSLPDGIAGGVD